MHTRRHHDQIISLPSVQYGVLVAAVVLALASAPAPAAAIPPIPSPEAAEAPAVSLPSPVGALDYTPGRGLRVGDTRCTIGGYTNFNLTREEGAAAQLKWDDLSIFVIADPTPRVHFFSELEFEDLVEVDDHGRGGRTDNRFLVERLYADVAVADQLKLRAGKFLTPIGRWNVIHAQPLVWTTSRPLATLLPFDAHTTGAMLFGSFFPGAGNLTYSLFGQFVNQFEPVEQPQRTDRSGGVHLEYATHSGWSVGASYLAFTNAGAWQHLGGLDTLWRHGPLELMGEFAYEDTPRAPAAQWGLYLQGVLEVLPQFYLVGRYEHFDQRGPHPEVNLFDAGVAYRPQPYLLLKAEYLFTDHRAEESPPGIKASVAILF